jgi:phage tail sheath protein FI
MPEYLAPGVYVEEVSFRSKTIEGVATSTTGFAGMTRTGPVQYVDGARRGPSQTEPRLITSFTDFERVYGGIEPLAVHPDPTDASSDDRTSYLAHAARAFFLNGGKRLYVSRVYKPLEPTPGTLDWGIARRSVAVAAGSAATWRARWPGTYGNVLVSVEAVRSKNVAFTPADHPTWGVQARRAKPGALVEILDPPLPDPLPVRNDPLVLANLAVVQVDADGRQTFVRTAGGPRVPNASAVVQLVELRVIVQAGSRIDQYDFLGVHPDHRRAVTRILDLSEPADEDAIVWLDWSPPAGAAALAPELAIALQGNATPRLAGGGDGALMSSNDLAGQDASLDDANVKATGLAALGEIDDIAIVAAPDSADMGSDIASRDAAQQLVAHAELMRYRIAVVDAPQSRSMSQIRDFRGHFDSTRAALYYPWIAILDPLLPAALGAPPPQLLLPPSGFVCGIYARSDTERGVFKAPANEVVRGLTRFEANINAGRQSVLNPEGINSLRFFEGRGSRVWGARTMTSDPEWKYVNVRRLFIYLEHSIDKSTQYAVFEPNGPRLWANIVQSVEDFLLVEWVNGALLGDTPAEAFFVRCDRTTMTQNDFDNGRMICLIGVAPVKPAEFVIFRIGQFTAEAQA